jgi:AraC family cel operon transcriptional repressor
VTLYRCEARHILDPRTGTHYAAHSSFEALFTQLHDHDFYELFLVTDGRLIHEVNGEALPIAAGALVLIRPPDQHRYQKASDRCRLINLAFALDLLAGLAAFLETDAPITGLDAPALPPMRLLAPADHQQVHSRLEALNQLPPNEPSRARATVRALIADLLTAWFLFGQDESASGRPRWLDDTCAALRDPAQFVQGRAALRRLTGRSDEHVARMFRQHLGMTPTAYLNGLRLDYAANLLRHSDAPILDIILDCGFSNVSHFYHQFQARFGVSPRVWRLQHPSAPIP